jgi:hypothetical protein
MQITEDTQWYLYSTGITSMALFGEFFPTHDSVDKFVKLVNWKEGKTIDIPIYRNPNFTEFDFTLRFPLVQQNWLKALCLYAIGHAYSGIGFIVSLDCGSWIVDLGSFDQPLICLIQYHYLLIPRHLLKGTHSWLGCVKKQQ